MVLKLCMWEKIVPFWRDLSLHIYGTTQERLGFNASNIILGEIPLTPPQKKTCRKFQPTI